METDMQEALRALVAAKQKLDEYQISIEEFQDNVGVIISGVIKSSKESGVDSSTVVTLLEECHASNWISGDQYLNLRNVLLAPTPSEPATTSAGEAESSRATPNYAAPQQESHTPKYRQHKRQGSVESEDLGSSTLNHAKQGHDSESHTPPQNSSTYWHNSSMQRMGSLAKPVEWFMRLRNIPLNQNESVARTKDTTPVVPKRYVIRTQQWVMLCVTIALLGIMGLSGYNIYNVLVERHATWQWVALGLIPIMFFFFAFGVKVIFGTLWAVFFSSVRALNCNSEFYSAVPTPIMPGKSMPPVLVQVPVYKEDLKEVIVPTYQSVKKAMDYYKKRGGKARMLICDDGLLLVDDKQFAERVNFYRKRDIAFLARPPKNRRGLFKKASNMNYTFKVIEKVKTKMNEKQMELRPALSEVWTDMGSEFVGGGDLTIPDDAIILLLDADTRMPEDAIHMTMGEFIEDQELPYTQHFTTPFSEQNRNFWEQTISAFTRKIYTAGIAAGTCTGDFAPLVGHNAFLRWSAVQSAAFRDRGDNNEIKYWSETAVSEDFDMFMRLAGIQKYGRYVMYTGEGFQEGVSLTYIDEIVKLRKFAYGACEMVFNPFIFWCIRGPFSMIILRFLCTRRVAWYQKVSLLSYLATYFALSAGPFLIVMESCFAVFAPGYYDHYAIRGFDVMLTCTVIFGGVASISEIMVRWRTESLRGGSLFSMVWDNVKFLPNITLLFTSSMFPLCTASACYFFSFPVSWGSTTKELTDLTCFQALRDTMRMFGWQYLILICYAGGFSYAVWWRSMTVVQAWGPLSFCGFHFLGPILLNPHIMSLAF